MRPDVPNQLAAICEQCIAPDPSQRIESAERVQTLLEGWITNSHPSSTAGQIKNQTLHPIRFGVLANVGLAIVLAFVWSIRDRSFAILPDREQPKATVSNERTSEEIELAIEKIEEEWLKRSSSLCGLVDSKKSASHGVSCSHYECE